MANANYVQTHIEARVHEFVSIIPLIYVNTVNIKHSTNAVRNDNI